MEITISAAASLKDALGEIKEAFEEENESVTLYYNFGSTGALKQQITQGAPTDLFFSASKEHFTELLDRKLIDETHSTDLLRNSLVVIGTEPLGTISSLKDLTGNNIERISIGTPETVPAGKYAKEALLSEKVWGSIEAKLVPTKDVRQVLSYVESKNVSVGIVYQTDALVSKKIKVLYEIPETLHTEPLYSVGVVKDTKLEEEAVAFYEFLQTKKAINIFEKHGFKGLK